MANQNDQDKNRQGGQQGDRSSQGGRQQQQENRQGQMGDDGRKDKNPGKQQR